MKFAVLLTNICFCLCATSKRPHIIFLLADDLGWNDVSFHGSKQIPTPNIDIFARDGIVLNNYYVTPLCSPSRASLMTGKYATRLGLQHSLIINASPAGLPLDEKILPEYLNELGYASHAIGKWHLGFFEEDYLPRKRGFKSYFGILTSFSDYYTHFCSDVQEMTGLALHDNELPAWGYDGQYVTDIYTKKAKDIIRDHNSTQPLFLYVAHQAPHFSNMGNLSSAPFEPPPWYEEKFSYIQDEERRKLAGIISALDNSVGEIIQSLEQSGMLDDSLIIFSTDNGGAVSGCGVGSTGSNFPLRGSKGTLWEGGVRGISWLWSASLRNWSRTENSLFHITDWLPTLYAAAGGDSNLLSDLNGTNQWPIIKTDSKQERHSRRELLYNVDDISHIWAVRRNSYKLISGSFMKGILDGWFDMEGRNVSDRGTPFSQAELEQYDSELRKDILSSRGAKIMEQKYGISPAETASAVGQFKVEVVCGAMPENASTDCKPLEAPCLYNIDRDPCEYNNIASLYPQIVEELTQFLNRCSAAAVPPDNPPIDPNANPKLHGDVWTPWISNGYKATNGEILLIFFIFTFTAFLVCF